MMTRMNRTGEAALTVVLLAGLPGCGGGEVTGRQQPESTVEAVPEYETACSDEQRRKLPSAANALTVEDTRGPNVYACMYLLDMGVPVDGPLELASINPKTVESSNFRLKGELGGWAILGTGSVSGDVEASGSSGEEDVYKVRAKDIDGALMNMTLSADSVRIVPCEEPCTPELAIELPEEPLYLKKLRLGEDRDDDSSIWITPGLNDRPVAEQIPVEDAEQRLAVVSQVSNRLPNEPGKTSVSGGPKSPGEVMAALATSVTIKVPESALENF